MDLEINIECRKCGWLFKENLRNMPHGRSLKCPFCYSSALGLGQGLLVEARKDDGGFEPSMEDRFMERKIKL